MFICVDRKKTRFAAAALTCLLAARAVGARAIPRREPRRARGYEWGLYFEKDNRLPRPNLPDEELNPMRAYFHGDTGDNTLYLTFDAGYENGYTRRILDALKKHGAPARFFLVGPYIEENPEIVRRMVREGHTVGNHSYTHPDMRGKSREEFLSELAKTERAFREATGRDMPKFYRPPEGKFSKENLARAKEAGYVTILWSSAYTDWDRDNQPSEEYAFEKIEKRTFGGAIFLLHSTSATNARILDRQLTKWEEAGYRFGDIRELEKSLSAPEG